MFYKYFILMKCIEYKYKNKINIQNGINLNGINVIKTSKKKRIEKLNFNKLDIFKKVFKKRKIDEKKKNIMKKDEKSNFFYSNKLKKILILRLLFGHNLLVLKSFELIIDQNDINIEGTAQK